ncbi:hypothetical protein FRACYDRAFT_235204 [Fragilariopsis cylindrus CCMP1102]|uniref:Uncharacterized protein n=1 Tax=Fragilariopsis cylindrus CCMP1102 TaxID=635003 RepID=A0A1E7FTT1_9STRA|nr:hypothetical protein FRACYDRAFT_235204 [Fragilariopsis cylindrus CCMP1102]|eukprot:OEU21578.1 hypothetical protein FRACYDRAFT_235204 [Fragilariopsis cylindrus CCMP1102]
MRLSTAVKFIILAHTSYCYVPSVLCKKGGMGDDTATATMAGGCNNERMLASSLSKGYDFRRNYIAIIEPDNFVSLFPNGGGIFEGVFNPEGGLFELQGSSTILNGKIYDPADIAIVNKFNGVEENDLTDEVIEFFDGSKQDALDAIGDFPFAGGRQPKQPIPPGDSAFFYHGLCVATSILVDLSFSTIPSVSSHSCKLNICLGGGGFNCIAFYAGTSFVFNLDQPLGAFLNNFVVKEAEPSLPPPFPATIIGGTGSFEGIEGTVDIATICGTTGQTLLVKDLRHLSQEKDKEEEVRRPIDDSGDRRLQVETGIRLGLIVQSISVNANMPLPVAP